MNAAYRYAVYLSPPDPWCELGNRWLGRSAQTGAATRDADPQLDAWTAAPRGYGLHATLKAPLRLRAGATPAALDDAMRALALSREPFEASIVRRQLRGFMAWCLGPDEASQHAMAALGQAAVIGLDDLRAPPSEAELARRKPEQLKPLERQMLANWGYPYALQTFTFHMTLTGHLSEAELQAADTLFAAWQDAAALPALMPVNDISVYVQPEPGADFIAARHYGFDGSLRDGAGSLYLPALPKERAA
jgi:hypothetical protein